MLHISRSQKPKGRKRGNALLPLGALAVASLATLATRSTTGTSSAPVAPAAPAVPRGRRTRGRGKKILLSLSALGVAGAMAGLGTFAAYTSTTSSSATVTTGVVHIALAVDGTGNRIDVAATGVLPGDTVARAVDLTSTSTDALASVKLTTTAPTTSSTLNTDATNGLQLLIQKCSTAWTETANTAPQTGYSYTCGGTTTAPLASAAVIQAASTLTGLAATAGPGNLSTTMDHLLITMTLPSGTIESQVAQGSSSVIVFTFNAAQRTGPTTR